MQIFVFFKSLNNCLHFYISFCSFVVRSVGWHDGILVHDYLVSLQPRGGLPDLETVTLALGETEGHTELEVLVLVL